MSKKLGVIVGRFQCAELTGAHKKLIASTIDESDEVLIFIGTSQVRNTKNEPLSFDCRKSMVENFISKDLLVGGYKHIISKGMDQWILTNRPSILQMNDVGNLPIWCEKLDKKIDEYINGKDMTVTIYGGRDSVVNYYKGKYSVKEIETISGISATKTREELYKKTPWDLFETAEFRSGVIYASQCRYPTGYPTADVACVRDGKILLCRKADRGRWSLIGGFFDPTLDSSLEETALRELKEETGIDASNPKYITSYVVEHDFRYKKETDKILTTLYQVDWIDGEGIANDDISETKWVDINELSKDVEKYIIIDHLELVKKFLYLYIK